MQSLFAQKQNLALILLLFALLSYSAIGFSIDISAAAVDLELPAQEPADDSTLVPGLDAVDAFQTPLESASP
jgi:hypothetical protein